MKKGKSGFWVGTFAAVLGLFILQTAQAEIYAGRFGAAGNLNIVSRYSDTQAGDVAPAAVLGGAATA